MTPTLTLSLKSSHPLQRRAADEWIQGLRQTVRSCTHLIVTVSLRSDSPSCAIKLKCVHSCVRESKCTCDESNNSRLDTLFVSVSVLHISHRPQCNHTSIYILVTLFAAGRADNGVVQYSICDTLQHLLLAIDTRHRACCQDGMLSCTPAHDCHVATAYV